MMLIKLHVLSEVMISIKTNLENNLNCYFDTAHVDKLMKHIDIILADLSELDISLSIQPLIQLFMLELVQITLAMMKHFRCQCKKYKH